MLCFVTKSSDKLLYTQQEKCELLPQTINENHSISSNLSDPATVAEVDTVAENIRNMKSVQPTTYFITDKKLSDIIKGFKSRKSAGLDRVTNKCIKNRPKKAVSYLRAIISACLSQSYIFP